MNSTQAYIGLGLAFVGGTALGAGIGYRIAVSKLNLKYNELMEAELERTREFYARTHKAGEYETPESAAEALGVVGQAADALLEYQGQKTTTVAGVVVVEETEPQGETVEVTGQPVIHQNVFDRNRDKPYVISQDEYMANDEEFEQVSVTYFAGDDTVAHEDDAIPEHAVMASIGLLNLETFGDHNPDPNVIYVRNEKTRIDYEILKSDGTFAHEVAGFHHSDATFEPMRRRKSADE